jgi:hypothetical protein
MGLITEKRLSKKPINSCEKGSREERDWLEQELLGCKFKDERLEKRFKTLCKLIDFFQIIELMKNRYSRVTLNRQKNDFLKQRGLFWFYKIQRNFRMNENVLKQLDLRRFYRVL